MATTDKNKVTEALHIRNFRSYNTVTRNMSDAEIDELIDQGSLQGSSVMEHAVAQTNGHITVVGKNTHDLSDFSDCKMITARRRDKLTTYSAPIKKFKNKIGTLRVQCLERNLERFYYFLIPHSVYINASTIEIPFNRDGTPNRQSSFQGINWWDYEVATFEEMAQSMTDPVTQRRANNENLLKSLFSFGTHTGGKIKGQLSQTPNAIRKRAARARAREAQAART